jgi:hypothetical protein
MEKKGLRATLRRTGARSGGCGVANASLMEALCLLYSILMARA